MKSVPYSIITLLLSATAAFGQHSLEGGIKGGATFTHGYTTIPSIPLSATLAVPQLNNKNNGVGTGYSFGLWGRQNFNKFFVQVEVDVNRFVLKQKTDLAIPAGLAAALAGFALPPAVPAQTPASVNIVSESVLQSVNVPILFGRRWADGKIRAFIGPNLLFTTKAQATRNSSASVAGLSVNTPQTTTDLKNPNRQNPTESILEVKPFTYAAEVGVGYTFFRRLDLDLRYAVPVGGIYKNADIKGFLGIATATVGLRVF